MKQSVITIGTFDGLHKGHQAILKKIISLSKENNLKSIVVAIEKPTKCVPGLLSLPDEKIELLSGYFIDEILLLPADKEIISMTAGDFFYNVIVKELKASHIVVGSDFAFGKNRTGNIKWLKKITRENNIYLDIVKPVKEKKRLISSSAIRKLIIDNEIKKANGMLGRYFEFSGVHVGGNKIGRTIGFPTVNLSVENLKLLPKGIFLCYITDKFGMIHYGVLNIGTRPTVKNVEHNIVPEVHLLDYSGKWKSKKVKVSILGHIRNEKKFKDLSELKKQIKKDVCKAGKMLGNIYNIRAV